MEGPGGAHPTHYHQGPHLPPHSAQTPVTAAGQTAHRVLPPFLRKESMKEVPSPWLPFVNTIFRVVLGSHSRMTHLCVICVSLVKRLFRSLAHF